MANKTIYRLGDAVRVKPGTKDPDHPEVEIGGWQGRVTDLTYANQADEPVIGLTWDSHTLRAMSLELIKRCERENLDWQRMYLSPDEIEPAQHRDTERDVQRASWEIEKRIKWRGSARKMSTSSRP